MSNTYTKKVHKGEVKKRENEIENKKKEAQKEEMEEAEKWAVGAKKTTGNDLKIEKLEKERKHKEQLKILYEKEME